MVTKRGVAVSKVVAGPTGVEPAAYGLRVRRSGLTELRARVFSLEIVFLLGFRGFGFGFSEVWN